MELCEFLPWYADQCPCMTSHAGRETRTHMMPRHIDFVKHGRCIQIIDQSAAGYIRRNWYPTERNFLRYSLKNWYTKNTTSI